MLTAKEGEREAVVEGAGKTEQGPARSCRFVQAPGLPGPVPAQGPLCLELQEHALLSSDVHALPRSVSPKACR